MKKILIITSIIALVLIFGVIVFLFTTKENSNELNKIDVRLKWLHQAQFAGNYVAKEKGFYDESGLDVTLLKGGVDSPAIPDVLNSNSDYGIAGADDLIVAVSEGKDVKAIAVIYKLSPVCYFSLIENNIQNPHDFIGKTVGIKEGTGTSYSYITMLKNTEINRSQINEVKVAYDLSQLYHKEVDVWPGFRINEPHVAEEAGYKVNLIYPEDWGVTMYADVLFTTNEKINNHKEEVKSFVTSTLEGWQYAIENEEETIDITMQYSEGSTRSHQSYMLSKSIPLIHTGDSQLGLMESKIWQDMVEILYENTIIKEKPNLENLYTNEFLSD